MKTATSLSHLRFRWEGPLAGFMAFALAALLGTGIASAQTASSAGHSTTAMQAVASARPQAAAKPVPQNEEEKSEAKQDDASHQGIKVHGHWKIDIKNPDGSLATSREFENALNTAAAPSLLGDILTGQVAPGGFEVQVFPQLYYQSSPCNTAATADFACFLFTGTSGQSVAVCKPAGVDDCSSNLLARTVTDTNAQFGLVLSGSVVATANGYFDTVLTAIVTCSLTSEPAPFFVGTSGSGNGYTAASPQTCSAGTATNLSYAWKFPGQPTLPLTGTAISAINVLSGQTIQITVTITFS